MGPRPTVDLGSGRETPLDRTAEDGRGGGLGPGAGGLIAANGVGAGAPALAAALRGGGLGTTGAPALSAGAAGVAPADESSWPGRRAALVFDPVADAEGWEGASLEVRTASELVTRISSPHLRHFMRTERPATFSSAIWYFALQLGQRNFIRPGGARATVREEQNTARLAFLRQFSAAAYPRREHAFSDSHPAREPWRSEPRTVHRRTATSYPRSRRPRLDLVVRVASAWFARTYNRRNRFCRIDCRVASSGATASARSQVSIARFLKPAF